MNELSRFKLSLAHGHTTPFDFDQASVDLIRRSRFVARRMAQSPGSPINMSTDTVIGVIQIPTRVRTPVAKLSVSGFNPAHAVNAGEWTDPLPYRWLNTESLLAA